MCHFLLVICSNNVSNLHRFRDITTFTVYVTACDLEKSINFTNAVKITGQVRCLVHVLYFPRSSKDINGNSDLQSHSRSLLLVPFDRQRNDFLLVYDCGCLCRVPLLKQQLFPKNQRGHVTMSTPLWGSSIMLALVLVNVNISPHTKIEMPRFTRSKDIIGPKIKKMTHVTLTTPI